METTRRWPVVLAAVVAAFAIMVGLLVGAVPFKDGARDWFAPLIKGGWMAWTFPTALFFLTIFFLMSLMAVWEYASPGGNPRVGILALKPRAATGCSCRCSAAPSFISPGLDLSVRTSGGLWLYPWSTPSAYSAMSRN